MCLGCICNGKRKPLPRASRVEGSLIVPGTKQSKELTSIIIVEQAIDLIQSPDKLAGNFLQNLSAYIPFKIQAWAATGIPVLVGEDLKIKLIGQHFRQREQDRFDRFELGRVEFLKISKYYFGSCLPLLV